jgi:hypothetical protein
MTQSLLLSFGRLAPSALALRAHLHATLVCPCTVQLAAAGLAFAYVPACRPGTIGE